MSKKETAPYSAFEAAQELEIAYGVIAEVEEIPKANKLLKLTVDFGDEHGTKTIISGIKKDVEDWTSLKGQGSFFVLNFEPREMMGVVSEGMILPFSRGENNLILGGEKVSELLKGIKMFGRG